MCVCVCVRACVRACLRASTRVSAYEKHGPCYTQAMGVSFPHYSLFLSLNHYLPVSES